MEREKCNSADKTFASFSTYPAMTKCVSSLGFTIWLASDTPPCLQAACSDLLLHSTHPVSCWLHISLVFVESLGWVGKMPFVALILYQYTCFDSSSLTLNKHYGQFSTQTPKLNLSIYSFMALKFIFRWFLTDLSRVLIFEYGVKKWVKMLWKWSH